MKFSTVIILVIMIITSGFGFAQNANPDPKIDSFLTQRGITEALKGVDHTGSAYIDENFQLGAVYRNGEMIASNAALRYNALRDEFEFKKNLNEANSGARIVSKSKDIYVKIKNRLFVFSEVTSENIKPGYFEVLFEGEPMSLYRKVKKEFIEGKKAINSISTDILPNLKEKEMVYLLRGTSNFTELPGSKSGKINSFGNNKKTLKSYIKEQDLSINQTKDLVKLVAYYNTLTSK